MFSKKMIDNFADRFETKTVKIAKEKMWEMNRKSRPYGMNEKALTKMDRRQMFKQLVKTRRQDQDFKLNLVSY